MKHAGAATFERLERLLQSVRAMPVLKEKSRGTFYSGGRAFLHFHEHGDSIFADVRLKAEFERFRVNSAAQRARLLRAIKDALKP